MEEVCLLRRNSYSTGPSQELDMSTFKFNPQVNVRVMFLKLVLHILRILKVVFAIQIYLREKIVLDTLCSVNWWVFGSCQQTLLSITVRGFIRQSGSAPQPFHQGL